MNYKTPNDVNFCSPRIKPSSHGCFDKSALINIANNYNENNNDKIVFSINTPYDKLWNIINSKIQKMCDSNTESCWDQNIYSGYFKDYYKPLIPDSKYKWLRSSDIDDVLKQYEEKYNDFTFLGAVPIDFDIVIKEIALLNPCKLISKGKTRIAFVFNLDKHTQKGSHWVCMFLDFHKESIYFFDSVGNAPPKEVKTLINRLTNKIKSCTGLIMKTYINNTKHQTGNSECGVYCLFFIEQMLLDVDFNSLNLKRINDEIINKFRLHFFQWGGNISKPPF